MSETPQWTSKERYEQQLVVDRIVEVLQQQFPNKQVGKAVPNLHQTSREFGAPKYRHQF